MADESLVTVSDAEALAAAGACQYFNLRLSKCGGLAPAIEMAGIAEAAGLRYQLGCQVGETAILSAAGRAFAAWLEAPEYVEGSFGSLLLEQDISHDRIEFGKGGSARVLDGQGLGITVDEERLRNFSDTIIQLGQG